MELEEFRRCAYPATPWKKAKERLCLGLKASNRKAVLLVPHYRGTIY